MTLICIVLADATACMLMSAQVSGNNEVLVYPLHCGLRFRMLLGISLSSKMPGTGSHTAFPIVVWLRTLFARGRDLCG